MIHSNNNSRHIGSRKGGEGRRLASFAILYAGIYVLLSQASLSPYKTPAQSDEEKYDSSLRPITIRRAESSPFTFKEDSSFCYRWDPSAANNRSLQPFDMWLTHHPTWVVSNETDEQFCVEPGNKHDHPHIRHQLQFYANQFHSSCDRVHIRTMWGSGWGASFINIQAGLVYAFNNYIPLVVQDSGIPWIYTANKNDSTVLTCDEGDTTCYFLPYHDCKTSSAKYWNEQKESGKAELVVNGDLLPESGIGQELGKEAYRFMTRKMLWFRRAVFDYKQAFKKENNIAADSDCTVFHVRRGDVVLDTGNPRRYFPVFDYVKHMNSSKLSNPNHYIFLLTDDSGAIDEAHEFFPDMSFKHFDRPRHKGSNKGKVWENHTPSRDPAMEVIVLVATFELVQECSAIVWGASNFAHYMYNQMLLVNPNVESYRVDEDGKPINSPEYNNTESDLENYLNELRKNNSVISMGITKHKNSTSIYGAETYVRQQQQSFLRILLLIIVFGFGSGSLNLRLSLSDCNTHVERVEDRQSTEIGHGVNEYNTIEGDKIQKVFIWPHGYPHSTIGELRQILRDGVDRSSRLEQTLNIDEDDVIFAVDFHRSNCDSVEALVQDSLVRRAKKNSTNIDFGNSTIRKLVLFDFRDLPQMDSWQCLERLSNLLGKDRVSYGCRNLWEGRDIAMVDKTLDEPFGVLGQPRDFSDWQKYSTVGSTGTGVHLLRYPVRSDMAGAMERMIETDYPNVTDRGSGRVDHLPRPIDVVSFTEVSYKTLASVTLRGHVSELIENMTKANASIAAIVGQRGFVDETGRSTPQIDYMKKMLESKIVVTAQRDGHEDHYRFFEAVLSGALVMTDPMHPLPLEYVHEQNVIVYNSLKELEGHVLFYLSHPEERKKIARAGYDLAMEKHRSWHVVERILLD